MSTTTAAIPRRRGMTRAARIEELWGYLFISPWLIGFIVLTAGAMLGGLGLSFFRYDIITPPRFVGLANYEKMFFDDWLFWHSLRLTAQYAVFSVFLGVLSGLGASLLLNQKVRGLTIYRTIYYLPSVVSAVAAAMMWAIVFHADFGLVNGLLKVVGIEGPRWLSSTNMPVWTFIIIANWNVGVGIVIYLAALQGVPTTLYEAAIIDGAGRWQKFWHITLPMISPVIFFNVVMGIIGSLQVFTIAFILSEAGGSDSTIGGPANASMFFVLYLYMNAFRFLKMGYASALALALFVIILILTVVVFKASGRWVYYEGALKR
jgi:multiple sugar transport system permease protein